MLTGFRVPDALHLKNPKLAPMFLDIDVAQWSRRGRDYQFLSLTASGEALALVLR